MNISIKSNVPGLESREDNILPLDPNIQAHIDDRAQDILNIEQTLIQESTKQIESAKEIINAPDPLLTKSENGDTKKKTKGELIDDIKQLEQAMNLPNKAVSRLTKTQLEKYLVELIQKSGEQIQEQALLQNTSQINAEDIKTAKDRIMYESKSEMDKVKRDNVLHSQGGEFLYRAHFTIMYLLEKASVATEERTNVNITGVCDRMETDKDKVLMPLYLQIYKENEEIIKQYGNPIMQLVFYTLSTCGLAAADNIRKKQTSK